jgi:hypothetical protein
VRKFPKFHEQIGSCIGIPNFHELLCRFLYDQIYPNAPIPGNDVAIAACPNFNEPIAAFSSAYAYYYAPSDICGLKGMASQVIHSTRGWKNAPARYDCILAENDPTLSGLPGMFVGQVLLFFSFNFRGCDYYPCALVKWFKIIGEGPCPITGMWRVQPEFDGNQRVMSVIHVGSIVRGVHLIPIYGQHLDLDTELQYSYSLDAFQAFYVSPYSDYHAFQLLHSKLA